MATRESILAEYDVDSRGLIRSPGKFESEMLYVPYFWEVASDGIAEELAWSDDTTTYVVDIEDEDRAIFPELDNDVVALHLEESDSGFVSCATLTRRELAELHARNAEDSEDSED